MSYNLIDTTQSSIVTNNIDLQNAHTRIENHIYSVLDAQITTYNMLIQHNKFWGSNASSVYEEIWSNINTGFDAIYYRSNEDTAVEDSLSSKLQYVDNQLEFVIASDPKKEKYDLNFDRNVNFLHTLVRYLLANNPLKKNEIFRYQNRSTIRRDTDVDIIRTVFNIELTEDFR